jgi:hypothetical protein
MSNFMKTHPVGAKLFHAVGWTDRQTDGSTDRQTDVMKLIFAFYNFVNAPKNTNSESEKNQPIRNNFTPKE